MLNISVPLAT